MTKLHFHRVLARIRNIRRTQEPTVKPDEPHAGGYFPFQYLTGFIHFLKRNADRVTILTYDDLCWQHDDDYRNGYRQEFREWSARMERDELDSSRIYVLLQHDADSRPERTMQAVEAEASAGISSNIMVFRRRINRQLLKSEHQVQFTDYPLDFRELARLEREHRFVIGYHNNALEQALWDEQRAHQVFVDDVLALRQMFSIDYCSAHGGVPNSDGRNNRDLDIPPELHQSLRWVHNGATPFFHKQYSDGGINNPSRDPEKRDLRDFVRTWKPGCRYRVLTHPQYYNSPFSLSPALRGTPWYDQLVAMCEHEPGADPWQDVELSI